MVQSKSEIAGRLEAMDHVRTRMLDPRGLDLGRLDGLMQMLMSRQIDYADLYFQLVHHESWSVEDGIVKDGTHSVDQGVGVRAVAGEKTGFAYADKFTEEFHDA